MSLVQFAKFNGMDFATIHGCARHENFQLLGTTCNMSGRVVSEIEIRVEGESSISDITRTRML